LSADVPEQAKWNEGGDVSTAGVALIFLRSRLRLKTC
jgi:hypothetical protein